ncbi:MAG: class I SAM-dependent methyltransferase [Lentisphaerae bacterium]|nr:MAG: class I SAM-dependent methyltransferase [Lentisphaerota bacterium]
MRFGSYDDARYYFIDCILNDRPYWSDNPADPIMQTIMGSVSRMAALVALIRYFMETGVRAPRILEIGSFCGSSAVTMARALLRYHEGRGHITCIDPWAWTDRHPRLERNTWFDRNGKDIATYTYEDMFHHNVRSSGVADLITAHKGFSHDVLPALGDAKFDLVYVDGDHSYEGVLGDLRRCAPLLAENGILCGDDLDIQIPDLEEAKARQYTFSRAEHIRNWGRIGCPGITLALHEFFGRPITCVNGFFAQQKRDDGWQDLPWLKTAAPYSIDEVRKSLHSGPDLDIQRSPHPNLLAVSSLQLLIRIVAVLDDNPPQEVFFQGIVPVRAEDWEPCDCDLIILSSDCAQEQMARRCRELYGDAIPLLDLYAGLPGPVAKYNMDNWN